MRRTITLVSAGTAAMLLAGTLSAQDAPAYWAVTGVSADDTLNLRDVPSADSKSLARIPPNARGLMNLGCRRTTLGLQDWMHMTKSDRQGAQTLWCRVSYQGLEGWVAGRFLVQDAGPRQ